MTSRVLTAALLCAAALGATGCLVPQYQYDEVKKQLTATQDQVRKLQEDKEGLQRVVVAQQKQIDSLMALGDKRLDLIPHVVSIDLGAYTGGFYTDVTKKSQGQDAVKVYMLPKDQDTSVIKAGGSVTIQLYDLALTENNLLGEYHLGIEDVSKNWYSGFMSMTYHYSFVCPFKTPPKHSEVTVRVEFVDYITGKHFTTQKVVNVILPPTTRPG